VTLDITNKELANAANITPFTASLLISEWQRNRALVKRRGKILLQSPDWLLSHPRSVIGVGEVVSKNSPKVVPRQED